LTEPAARRRHAADVTAAQDAAAVQTGEIETDLLAQTVAALAANGAESLRIAERADELAGALGGTAAVRLGWSESVVEYTDSGGVTRDRLFEAIPSTVGMNRVMATDDAVNDFAAGRTGITEAAAAVKAAAAKPLANIWLFAAACAVGAVSLSVIFGAQRWSTYGFVALAAVLGAFVRRLLGRYGGNNFWQVGAAGLIAGLLGSVAVSADPDSMLRLAAVCPCMVLVPGPHLLNGSLDLAGLRIPLGIARLTFATVTLLAITAGLILGLYFGHAHLVLDPHEREIAVWLDALAGGVVAICYGVFYSAPLRILIWPFAIGAGVHALRWVALYEWHVDAWVGAGLACFVVGLVLIPVSRRFQVPFSAIGFASVVSLMPGLLVFRALSGLSELQHASGEAAQSLMLSVFNDLNGALLTVMAMALGFLVPAGAYRLVYRLRSERAHGTVASAFR
jgi:uncharacterized membrane protein YjjP (DUF1212 family)